MIPVPESAAYSNPLRDFTSSFGFVIFFVISTLIFTMVFGDDITTIYLTLVLLGMLVVNADKTVALMGKFS